MAVRVLVQVVEERRGAEVATSRMEREESKVRLPL